jgi:hypothetical protein
MPQDNRGLNMTGSIWPHDTYLSPKMPPQTKTPGAISCFLVSPYEPRPKWDDLFNLVKAVCTSVGQTLGVQIDCLRADSIASSGVIHPEIWEAILQSDFIICDVTGHNGNVMLELGIAAAWRNKEHVIIIRDTNDEKPRLFDINPARHVEYTVTFSGLQKLTADLAKVVTDILATIPVQASGPVRVSLPFRAPLSDGIDRSELRTEDITHRRLLPDCLEFGAPLSYRYSWMSIGDLLIANVSIATDLKLTLEVPPHNPFMGVMVRGQSFYANCGHLVFVRRDGTVYLTVREDDTGKYHDEPLGVIPNYDIHEFTHFDIAIDAAALRISVGPLHIVKTLAELPYVFSKGRLILIAGGCRIGVRSLEVHAIEQAPRCESR